MRRSHIAWPRPSIGVQFWLCWFMKSAASLPSRSGLRKVHALRYGTLAVELLRLLRGRRSCAEFSRRLGYRSNVVQRWEAQRCWPTAARYLAVLGGNGRTWSECVTTFFGRRPDWLDAHAPESPEGVAALLRQLAGKVAIGTLSELGGFSRYQVSRWLSGGTQPNLPEFLCLIEVMSRRLLDLLALVADPARLPSVAARWQQIDVARKAAYQMPWSHAVLRALEIETPQRGAEQLSWLSQRVGLSVEVVRQCLDVLLATGQVREQRGRLVLGESLPVTTAQDVSRAREVKVMWTRTALERLEQGKPGNFGYSLFAASRSDLRRLRELHLEYVRAMQAIVAASTPNECVGLFCAQFVDLAVSDNALAE